METVLGTLVPEERKAKDKTWVYTLVHEGVDADEMMDPSSDSSDSVRFRYGMGGGGRLVRCVVGGGSDGRGNTYGDPTE